jgi:glucose/arabinose dehydrogenase
MLGFVLTLAVLAGTTTSFGQEAPDCDPDNGGLVLPEGFCALVVADDVGRARHLVVTETGDIYIALRGRRNGDGGGVLALRDGDGDGKADTRWRHDDDRGGTGIGIFEGYLYYGRDDAVLRFPMREGELAPAGEPETVVSGLPADRSHRAKSLAFGTDGALYVNVGSPSNSCQEEDRTPGSTGRDPCPELETHAGIWRFDGRATGQGQDDGTRFATGLRNTVALAWNPADERLYGVVHGRDQLHQNWSGMFTEEQSAENPSEEFIRISESGVYSWPYCIHVRERGGLILAPEYGGDGQTEGRCAGHQGPILAFPGHWGPNALLFYMGDQFPDRYRGGAFVAFHGSWNREPLPQQGYNVVFVPFRDGEPVRDFEVFADGFAGDEPGPRTASHRPSGLAMGPDGSLYVSDDSGGRIWRILHR